VAMMKIARTLFICFCLIGIWNSGPYFGDSCATISSIEKLSPTQTDSHSFEVFEKIEWEEDFNDDVSQKLAGTFPAILYFFKTSSAKFNVKSQQFSKIRSFFPPLYLRHCIYRI
jgi:hypothetical protein